MKVARSRTRPLRNLATYRLVVEYDGTDFCGFQYQPIDRTVAGVLEEALSRLFDEPVKLTCAGRTDAGVHATGQVVSFTSHDRFPLERLPIALNTSLPPDLTARDAARVANGFSARADAVERTYTYLVLNRSEPSAVVRRWMHHDHRALDLEHMRYAASLLVGERDFMSFCGVAPDRGGTTRDLTSIEIEPDRDVLRFHFRGVGFLHRMVRIMTGTLLDIGAGRRDASEIPEILAARNRRASGPTAPAHGLFFVGVRYADFDSSSAVVSSLATLLRSGSRGF
jgi:tRNA pseudouridine38-40 synthase